jgi:hypothetical protein
MCLPCLFQGVRGVYLPGMGMEVQGASCAVGIRVSPVDGLPPRVEGSGTFPLSAVSPPARAPRGAVVTRNERFAFTAARNRRKCWVPGGQIRDQAARCVLPLWLCRVAASCCLVMLGVCRVPGAGAFLHHAVSLAARVLRGTVITGNEGLASTAALNQPKFSISSLRSLTAGTGRDDPWRDRGLPRDPCIAIRPPIGPRSDDCMDRRNEARHSRHPASAMLHSL